MRDISIKRAESQRSDIQPIVKKWTVTDSLRRPKRSKSLTHSPSLRAMKNYNDLPIDRTSSSNGIDNPNFVADYPYEYRVDPHYSIQNEEEFDYPTMSTRSMKTSHSGGESDLHSTNEMGSSVKLVTVKVERSFKTWCGHVSTIFCTISMAAGLGNLYRLPQTTSIHGGLPFLIVYAVLTVIVGLPLLFLELGVGQMAQEGFIKSWRAVPFFKGIGYVKLLASCLLSLYYPLYIGLAILHLLWLLKGPVPFTECSNGVVITDDGYSAVSKTGQDCLRATFIKSPFEDPYYFGIYASVLLFVWIVMITLSIRRTKSYTRSLLILFFPMIACYIALVAKSVILENELRTLHHFYENVDWSVLKSAEIWYYATIQVFFSTNVGFGSFITNAGIMYNKMNPLWTALGYITINLIFGSGTVLMTSILAGNLTDNSTTPSVGSVAEVQLFATIYDSIVARSSNDFKYWMIVIFLLFIFAGFINMATLSYSLLKAIHGHDGIRLKWWQSSVLFTFTGFVLSCLLLLRRDFDLVHLLDHYVVGNLILICVVIEVVAFIAFYGTMRIQSDFEFMLGHILSKLWLFLWWLIPVFLGGVFVWGLATLHLEGIFKDDPLWLYALGWSIVLLSVIFIFAMGIYIVRKQDGYTIYDRLKSSLEPSHNWGPRDPMLRYNWVQWNSKSQAGERDFTLKRRGTKEYTNTIRKKAKKEALAEGLAGSYLGSDSLGNRVKNGTNPRLSNGHSNYDSLYCENTDPTSKVVGSVLIDNLEEEIVPNRHHHHHHYHHYHRKPLTRNTFPTDDGGYPYTENSNNRHSSPATHKFADIVTDENSEGYGTFRNKGPYIIDGDIGHVCYKRYDGDEAVTQL